MDKNKLKWMSKLARTSNYIVITDTELVVCLRLSKDRFNDTMIMAQQKAALERIRDRVDTAITAYDTEVNALLGKPKLVAKRPKAKGKKINVTQL